MRVLAAVSGLAVSVGLALVCEVGCSNDIVHPFGGYIYDATLDCIFVSGAIDVVAGPITAPCPILRCWIAPCGAVYVTDSACDAPPGYVNATDATSGPCVNALKIYATTNHGQCANPPDGGGGSGAGGACGL